MLIVSNNPLVRDAFQGCRKIDGSVREVVLHARDLVHLGYPLLGHPLAGSIRLQNNPYRSLILGMQPEAYNARDVQLVEQIAARIEALETQTHVKSAVHDYQYIDFSLLMAALGEETDDGRGLKQCSLELQSKNP